MIGSDTEPTAEGHRRLWRDSLSGVEPGPIAPSVVNPTMTGDKHILAGRETFEIVEGAGNDVPGMRLLRLATNGGALAIESGP